MKTSTGFEQCYNGQLAVDGEFQIIVANHQGNNANDNDCLVPLLDEVEATLGGQPEQCLADAGDLLSAQASGRGCERLDQEHSGLAWRLIESHRGQSYPYKRSIGHILKRSESLQNITRNRATWSIRLRLENRLENFYRAGS